MLKVYLGSPVAPICTIKKIKLCPICLQLGHVLFMGIFYNYGSVLIEKYRAIILFHVNVYVLIESYTDEVFIKEFVMVDTCTCDIPFVICVEASNRAIMLTKFLDATHLYFQGVIFPVIGKAFQLGN